LLKKPKTACRRARIGIAAGTRRRILAAGVGARRGDTIALMAKFKPAKGKSKTAVIPQGGITCVILVIGGMFLLMLFMFFVMKTS
jgi:hypothetical protein